MKTKNPSCSTPSELYSINALSRLLAADRRTLSKHLDTIPPRRTNGRTRYYTLADAHGALAEDAHDPAMRKLRRAKLNEEVTKLKTRNEVESGRLVRRSDVCVTIQRIFGSLLPQIEQLLIFEFPHVVTNDPITNRIYGKKLYDRIVAAHAAFADAWKEI